MKSQSGMTLMELIVATFILSVGVMAAVTSFQYITTSIQHSKSRTLSNNLGQEQIEKLKNLSYYSLLVTTAPVPDSHFPSIAYDTGFYAPQTLIEGGIRFTRATRVDVAIQNGTTITLQAPSAEDTGLKQITVYTIWQEGGTWQYKEIHNLMANPATSPLNATITGSVKVGITNIGNALVQAIDNPQYYAYTNSLGVYRFTVSEGSYTLRASSQGYFTQDAPGYISVTSNGSNGYPFQMTAMSSGAATGYVYRNDHIVISQVVGSTASAAVCQEYVELYNPTTNYVQMVQGMAIDIISLKYQRYGEAFATTIDLDYTVANSSIPPHGYFLIANTPVIYAGGVTRTADAVYNSGFSNPDYPNIIRTSNASCGGEPADGNADSVGIAWTTTTAWIDVVGWQKNGVGHNPPLDEGTPINHASGLDDTEQWVRRTAPGVMNSGYGRAYDSNSNDSDFVTAKPLSYPPHNRTDIETPQSGTPAEGAIVNFNDPLSNTVTCDSTGRFSAPSIATGTWTMSVTSGTYYTQISTITIQATVSTGTPNGSTSPSWTSVGNLTNTLLSDSTSYAFVSGRVTNVALTPLNHIKIVDGNGRSTFSSPNGRFTLLASTGIPVQITYNPNDSDMNRTYVTSNLTAQTLTPGLLYDQISWPLTFSTTETTDVALSLAGTLAGYFKTTSNTAIPGRVAIAFNTTCGGSARAQAISDNTGHFYLTNLSTGTYCVEPSLDPAESVSPANYPSVTLTSTGTATNYSTFTITNGLSEITGQAIIGSSTQPITTGVLVVASTASLGAATVPPQVRGDTGMLCNPCYYATSSDATGAYTIPLRSNASPYFVYGWRGTTRTGPYSVTVSTAGQSISQNLTW